MPNDKKMPDSQIERFISNLAAISQGLKLGATASPLKDPRAFAQILDTAGMVIHQLLRERASAFKRNGRMTETAQKKTRRDRRANWDMSSKNPDSDLGKPNHKHRDHINQGAGQRGPQKPASVAS